MIDNESKEQDVYRPPKVLSSPLSRNNIVLFFFDETEFIGFVLFFFTSGSSRF